MKNKLPNLSKEQIEEALNSVDLNKILQEPKPKKAVSFRCSYCRDTKIEQVYGGPNRPCAFCGPRY